ncbi:MAG: sigma factor-like helix-turn-helix DNA-binding protein [Solirubrobacteraceae bacterium]
MRSEPDERAREMYRLRTVEGLTLRQLAERFQVSPERVRQLVYAYARAAGCQRSIVAISRVATAARRAQDLARAEGLAGELLAAWRDGAEPEQIAKAFGLRCRSVAEVLKRHKRVDDRAARAAARTLLRAESANESRRSG